MERQYVSRYLRRESSPRRLNARLWDDTSDTNDAAGTSDTNDTNDAVDTSDASDIDSVAIIKLEFISATAGAEDFKNTRSNKIHLRQIFWGISGFKYFEAATDPSSYLGHSGWTWKQAHQPLPLHLARSTDFI